jgi:uncharacterized protein YhjY with autotransporter beta-barrel domain
MKKTTQIKMKEMAIAAFFFFLVFIITTFAFKCNAQCNTYTAKQTTQKGFATYMGIANTGDYWGMELQAGYRYKPVSITAGYIAMLDAGRPALFQIRGGYNINYRVHAYAGYVWVTYSTDNRSLNYSTYVIGAQYHFLHFDQGTFYAGATCTPRFITASVGMSFNLQKEK